VKKPLTTELLLLPDGRILVHNLTQTFAELLSHLNPDDPQIRPRAYLKTITGGRARHSVRAAHTQRRSGSCGLQLVGGAHGVTRPTSL